MLPSELRPEYRDVLLSRGADDEHHRLVKAADKLCAYIKCLEEMAAGNKEFTKAEQALEEAVVKIDLPEVKYFLETFVPSFRLTLDELRFGP